MLSELLHDRAALYVAGAMTAAERENFELILEFHDEVRAHVGELEKVRTALLLSRGVPPAVPPRGLKERIIGALDAHPRQAEPDGLVVTGRDRLVEWINPTFTAMCGYALEELKGRKPGLLLQGPETDPAALQRIRAKLTERCSCRETLINYRKDGTRYQVDIAITPILDDEGQPLWFVAKERLLQPGQ